MHPQNIPCLTAVQIDYCALANNHVLDWGYAGLTDTLNTLQRAEIQSSGAGQNFDEAKMPARLMVPGKGRVLLFSYGLPSSGIPARWGASADKPGLNLLPNLGAETVQRIKKEVAAAKEPGDLVVVSVHWGGNWGYEIPPEQVDFAHQLVDEAGVDAVHGHSSHHFKGIEVYRDRPILYGAGDFLNDYEGIGGYEEYRPDLVLMYFVNLDPVSGDLVRLQMTPLQIKQFQLHRASEPDRQWVKDVLNRESRRFGVSVALNPDGTLILSWR
jgi:poly-gamma-glutamate synthesis protein (capsule biosynthesis protein)